MDETKEINLKEIKWRMLSLLDINNFKEAAIESVSSNMEFLAYGEIFDNISPTDFLVTYNSMLFKDKVDHYGAFYNGKLVGHLSLALGFSPYCVEVIGWVRNGFHSLGVGELGLAVAEKLAFGSKNFNYIVLQINQKNTPSRKAAEKAGFSPVLKTRFNNWTDECFITYIKISPRVMKLAKQYGLRALDLINNPCTYSGMQMYLASENVVEFFGWPFPYFDENQPPINSYTFEDFLARVNFSPKVIEAQMSDKATEGLNNEDKGN